MAEHPMRAAAVRRSPLQHLAPRLAAASSGEDGVVLEELRFPAAVNLRGDGGDARVRAGVAHAVGMEPPATANTYTHSGAVRCLWLGPDEWLIVSDAHTGERLAADLTAALAGQAVSIVDLSAGYATLRLSGRCTRAVLAKACPLDFHPRAFRVGHCAQSVFARTQAIVALESERPMFRLLVRTSFAGYLADWLLDAAQECRGG